MMDFDFELLLTVLVGLFGKRYKMCGCGNLPVLKPWFWQRLVLVVRCLKPTKTK